MSDRCGVLTPHDCDNWEVISEGSLNRKEKPDSVIGYMYIQSRACKKCKLRQFRKDKVTIL